MHRSRTRRQQRHIISTSSAQCRCGAGYRHQPALANDRSRALGPRSCFARHAINLRQSALSTMPDRLAWSPLRPSNAPASAPPSTAPGISHRQPAAACRRVAPWVSQGACAMRGQRAPHHNPRRGPSGERFVIRCRRRESATWPVTRVRARSSGAHRRPRCRWGRRPRGCQARDHPRSRHRWVCARRP